MNCPKCDSKTWKNGTSLDGLRTRYRCPVCGKKATEGARKVGRPPIGAKAMTPAQKAMRRYQLSKQ